MNAWIGLRDYEWSDESPLRFEAWSEGPGAGSGRSCAFFDTADTKWKKADCSEARGFVCKKRPVDFPDELPVCLY